MPPKEMQLFSVEFLRGNIHGRVPVPSFFSPNFPNKICNHRITVKTEKQIEFQDNITDKIKRYFY